MKPSPPSLRPRPQSGRPQPGRPRRAVPQRSSLSRWRWFVAILVVLFLGMGWQSWRWWQWAMAPVVDRSSHNSPPAVQLEIPSGTSGRAIGDRLQSLGLIRSATAWTLWGYWLNLQERWHPTAGGGGFQAGVYELSPTQSLPEVAQTIWTGQVKSVTITIPEGWSLQKMAQYFQDQGLFSAKDFLQATTVIPYDRFPWLPTNLPHLEGFLFPDTYQLSYSSVTPQTVIDLMLKRFEQVAIPLHDRATTSFTLKDWVILASIVEKEAVLPEERNRIAGVLLNRLKIGMRLEVDPTVEYGLGVQQTPDRPLSLEEVRTPSPYNTYLNEGLPPTPIASPGLGSLKAVLTPEPSDYLYFVARYDGTHVFSRTFAEHEAAQERIRSSRDH